MIKIGTVDFQAIPGCPGILVELFGDGLGLPFRLGGFGGDVGLQVLAIIRWGIYIYTIRICSTKHIPKCIFSPRNQTKGAG